MSHDLYQLRLYWEAGRGCAKVPGRYRNLSHPPQIPGLPSLNMIDYAPGVCAMLQSPYEARRDLTAPEITAVHAWLAHLFLVGES